MSVTTMSAAKAQKPAISRIDPTDWFVGMKNPRLQLMVSGPGIADFADVSTDYPGVSIDEVVRLDSPNYLFVYLNVGQAQPGTMTLTFKDAKQKTLKTDYQLKQRLMSGEEHRGFDISDVLYLLMPDRFAQGLDHSKPVKGMNAYREDRSQPSLRHGGDMEGIRQHLDYFQELGVTALWFTPVLENNSPDTDNGFSTYHGYACTDAHQRGLKVVMDMIFNHCGFEHPWVKDMPSKDWFNTPEWLSEKASGRDPMTGFTANADGSEPAKSAYMQTSYKLTPVLDPYATAIDLKETTEGWFVPSMPDLNQRNPHLMRYLIQNSKWWIETACIDGIRMDTYPWQKDSKLSAQNSYLKTVMDFSFFDKLNQAKNEETDGWWQGLNRLYNSFVYDYLYPTPSSVLAFIENHDTDRFLAGGRDSLMLKQALALLLTVNRIPQLYYGTEIMMNGTKEVTDGLVRQDFPGGFPGDEHNAFTREGRTKAEQQMFGWLSRLLHWRQTSKAVTEGSMKQFIPYNGVYVIARQYEDHALDQPNHFVRFRVLTVLNGTSKPATMSVERYAEVIGSATRARDVLTGRYYDLTQDVQLKPRQSLVLEF